jgi:hypothetical protein
MCYGSITVLIIQQQIFLDFLYLKLVERKLDKNHKMFPDWELVSMMWPDLVDQTFYVKVKTIIQNKNIWSWRGFNTFR